MLALLYQIYPEAFVGGEASCGEWKYEFLPNINQRILRIINTKHAYALESETVETKSPGHATLIVMGRSRVQVARYYTQLLAVVKDAQRLGSSVVWG